MTARSLGAGSRSGAFYKMLIVIATLIWGFSFVAMKDAVDVLPPAWLIGIRFLLTALILAAALWRHVRAALDLKSLLGGIMLGVLNFLAYWTQTVGLAFTTPGKNAFLTATYCVMVPFVFWLVSGKRPTRYNLLAALLCVTGMALVSLSGDETGLQFGDGMTLICAVFFAAHIVCVGHISRGRDVLGLTVHQFWVGGVLGILVGLFTEPAPSPSVFLDPAFLINLAYLILFASCIALVFQNIALAHVPPAQASVLLSLESVFGVTFSVICYGESLTLRLVAGFALIFGAILISELLPLKGVSAQTEPAEDTATINGSETAAAADLLLGDNMASGELERYLGFEESVPPTHDRS